MQVQWKWLGLVALMLVTAGCYRTVLNQEKTYDVVPGETRELIVEPSRREQKIKVEVSAAPAPVSVFVFLEKDRDAVKHDIETRKQQLANVLAREEKTTNVMLEATIPADNSAVVLITRASKDTKVTVKLTN
jgi:hypothetical protein